MLNPNRFGKMLRGLTDQRGLEHGGAGGQLDQTQGRGRMDRYHQADGSARKLLFLYPSTATSSRSSDWA